MQNNSEKSERQQKIYDNFTGYQKRIYNLALRLGLTHSKAIEKAFGAIKFLKSERDSRHY